MKKNFIILSSLISLGIHIKGQIGIQTPTPQATLDITGKPNDTDVLDGLLIPRLTGNQLRAKATTYTDAQNGAIIYVTAADTAPINQTINVKSPGYYSYDHSLTKWVRFQLGEDWNLTGNSGTVPGTHFIGTLDDQDIVFKRNNIQAGRLNTDNTSFGTGSLLTLTTGTGNVALGANSAKTVSSGANNTVIGSNAASNLTSGSNNIAIGNNAVLRSATTNNEMNIGNIIFGSGITGTSAAPTGNIGIGTNNPARRLDVNAASAPIRVTALQGITTGNPSTATAPIVIDASTGDIYQGKSSELLISGTNIIPDTDTSKFLQVTAPFSTYASSTGSIYNTTFTLSRPALITISYAISNKITNTSGNAVSDGTPRVIENWIRITNQATSTVLLDSLGPSSTLYSNSSSSGTIYGNFYNTSSSFINLPAGTYKIDVMALAGCSASQNVKATFGLGDDNLFIKADYN